MREMNIKEKLKEVLISDLNLVDVTPEEIRDDEPLFGDDGLGLDSLDAVEIIVIVQKHFGVEIRNMEEGKDALRSLVSLAKFIEERQ